MRVRARICFFHLLKTQSCCFIRLVSLTQANEYIQASAARLEDFYESVIRPERYSYIHLPDTRHKLQSHSITHRALLLWSFSAIPLKRSVIRRWRKQVNMLLSCSRLPRRRTSIERQRSAPLDLAAILRDDWFLPKYILTNSEEIEALLERSVMHPHRFFFFVLP